LLAAILLPSIVTLVPEPLMLVSQATAPGTCAEPDEEELLEDELDELLVELDEPLVELDELLVELDAPEEPDELNVPELVPPHPASNPTNTQADTRLRMEKVRLFIAGNPSRSLLVFKWRV
jgi:hypothetical protein